MIAASRITWVERHVVVASQHCNFFPNLVNFPPLISIPFLPSFSSFLPALGTPPYPNLRQLSSLVGVSIPGLSLSRVCHPPPLPCMSERGCLNSVEVCLKPAHLILGLTSTLSRLYVLFRCECVLRTYSVTHALSQSVSE